MPEANKAEAYVLADSRLAIADDPDLRLFRNNVGMLWDEKSRRMVRFGLCNGSSDLIGWRSVTITPDMVGQKVAIFVAAECKAKFAYPTPIQRAFIKQVKEMGGRAGVFRSGEELKCLTLRP